MSKNSFLLHGVSGLVLGMLAFPAMVQAQSSAVTKAGPNAEGNDIIVTARQVGERIQDVPIAVSAINGKDLKRQGIDDLSDIAEKTVGFSFESLSPIVTQPAIRGQTNLRTTSPVQNVAVYLDGNYLQRGYLIDQSLVELEQVEIIKGPQSALYGRNAFAGAIVLKTLAPSLTETHGNVSATVGTYGRRDARGYLTLPIIEDRLAIMVGAAHSQFDGTWANAHPLANADGVSTKGNLGGWNKQTYQARLIAKPTDWLKIDAGYIHTERQIEAFPSYGMSTAVAGSSPINTLNASPVRGQNRLFVGEIPATPILYPGETRLPGLVVDPRTYGLRGPTDVANVKIELTPEGPISATYQFGYTSASITGRGGANRNPLNTGTALATFDGSGYGSSFRGYNHDLRFSYDAGGRFHGLVGINYSHTNDIDSSASQTAPVNSLVLPADPFPIGPGLPIDFTRFLFQYLNRIENIYSGFAFASYDFTDKLSATVEGRYTIEDHKLYDYLPNLFAGVQPAAPTPFASSENYFTPRGTVSYKITGHNTVYFSAARGVKSGGLNGNVPYLPQRTYAPERNSTYEIGSKNTFFDRRVTLNISAYHVDWSNLQTNGVKLNADGTPPAAGTVPALIGNIGAVKVNGVEVEGSIRVAPPLTFDFGVSYNRSRYAKGSVSQRIGADGICDGIVCAATNFAPLPIAGNQLERVPAFDSRAGFTYEGKTGGGLEYYLRGDVSYQTKSYVDEANLAWVPSRFLINASAGLSYKNLSLSVYVKNLADKKYVSSAFFLVGTAGAYSTSYSPTLGERRTIGLSLSAGF